MYKTLDNILTQLEDNKALDIISIDLKGKSKEEKHIRLKFALNIKINQLLTLLIFFGN